MHRAGSMRMPKRRREVEHVLDEARAKQPAQVALVEAYLESSGFKAFRHGVSKLGGSVEGVPQSEPNLRPSASTKHLSPVEALVEHAADSTSWPRETGIRDLTIPERELLVALRNLGTPKVKPDERLRALIDGARLTARFFDERLRGLSNHAHEGAFIDALNQLHNGGKGGVVVVAAGGMLDGEDVRQIFETKLQTALREKAPPGQIRDESIGLLDDPDRLFPKSPRGVVLGLRAMAEDVAGLEGEARFSRASLAYSNAMTIGMREVAAKLGASPDEVKSASRRFFSESVSPVAPLHIMNTVEIQKNGEAWARAEFEKSYAKFAEYACSRATERLATDSAFHIHPKVWAHLVRLAGRLPPVTCKGVVASERALSIARDFKRDSAKKAKMVKACVTAATSIADLAARRADLGDEVAGKLLAKQLKAMDKALSTRVEGPLTSADATELGRAYEVLRTVAGTLVGPGHEGKVRVKEALYGSHLCEFIKDLLLDANTSGAAYTSSWNGSALYARPGEAPATVEARYRNDRVKPSLTASILHLFGLAQVWVADQLAASSFAATGLQAARPPQLVERDLERRLMKTDLSTHLRELSHPDEIVAYGRALEKEPASARRKAIDELYGSRYLDVMVPGTRPAWTLVLDRLARTA